MNAQEAHELFGHLSEDLLAADSYPTSKPLLAHYTTVPVLESMLRSNEVWFSNPLFMNDYEELRFGIENGMAAVRESATLRNALLSDERRRAFDDALEGIYNRVANNSVLDYYLLCLSQHGQDDNDGALSMWRAYGGNGSGVAVVFDSAKLGETYKHPFLILGKVKYGSTAERIASINAVIARFADRVAQVPDESLHLASFMLFEHLKFLALFTKHRGFQEEQEWRLVYLHERDPEMRLQSMLGYHVGPRGVEQKLKLKVSPEGGLVAEHITSLEVLIDRVILGPTIAAPIARAAVGRMLRTLSGDDLEKKLRASTIPYRLRM